MNGPGSRPVPQGLSNDGCGRPFSGNPVPQDHSDSPLSAPESLLQIDVAHLPHKSASSAVTKSIFIMSGRQDTDRNWLAGAVKEALVTCGQKAALR